jgi:hypothetical protein
MPEAKPHGLPHNPEKQGERAKLTTLAELRISETRDSITKTNDHKMIIFIDTKGNPADRRP